MLLYLIVQNLTCLNHNIMFHWHNPDYVYWMESKQASKRHHLKINAYNAQGDVFVKSNCCDLKHKVSIEVSLK